MAATLRSWTLLSICLAVRAQVKNVSAASRLTDSPSISFIPISFSSLSPTTLAPSSSPTFNPLNFPIIPQTPELSKVCCQELQWNVTATGVCLGTSDDCWQRLGWEASRDMCAAMGTRLCTANELSLFDAQQGCPIDNLRVWTSTRCRAANVAASGVGDGGYAVSQAASSSYLADVFALCENTARQQNVRCCADSQDLAVLTLPLNQSASQLTCAKLNWESSSDRSYCTQPCDVAKCLSQASNNNTNCSLSNLQSAINYCSRMGARLCSVNEVDVHADCLTDKQVWTRTTCASQAVYVVGGQGIECVPITRRYNVQCCAETGGTSDQQQNNESAAAAAAVVVVQTTQTCMQLGWTGVSNNTCATDRVVDGACRTNVDYAMASILCTGLGARMCSPSEIRSAVSILNGCLSTGFVWSTDSGCEFSSALAVGVNVNTTMCVPRLAQSAGVFCCADGPPLPRTLAPTLFPTFRPTASPTPFPSTLPSSLAPSSFATLPPSRRPRMESPPLSPAPTPPTPPTRAPTENACSTNNWPLIPSLRVCIATKLANRCPAADDWWAATSLCARYGARLCSDAELSAYKQDMTRQGCGSVRAWASDVCSNKANMSASVDMEWPVISQSKFKQLKAFKESKKVRCDSKQIALQVICCSEAPLLPPSASPTLSPNLPPTFSPSPVKRVIDTPSLEAIMKNSKAPLQLSGQSCQELGWNTSRGLARVCAASKVFLPASTSFPLSANVPSVNLLSANGSFALSNPKPNLIPKGKLECSPLLSYLEAVQVCQNLCARLCTSWELTQKVGDHTGCQLDSARVWTQTPCSVSNNISVAVLVQDGSSAVGLSCNLVSEGVFPVRCCADAL